jgi:hypothetical protein
MVSLNDLCFSRGCGNSLILTAAIILQKPESSIHMIFECINIFQRSLSINQVQYRTVLVEPCEYGMLEALEPCLLSLFPVLGQLFRGSIDPPTNTQAA